MTREYQICSSCVMDTSDPQIVFDADGKCDFCCSFEENILPAWPQGTKGDAELEALAEEIRRARKGEKYDCIIGFSGGSDSSYLAYVAVEKLGLNPLLVEVDTGWNLEVASRNTQAIKDGLGLDSVTVKINWSEMRSLQVAFLRSGVPYQDLPQDQAIFAALCSYATEHDFHYILTGANYSTECVKPPQEWTYFSDIRLMQDINKKFGTTLLKDYPLLGMFKKRFVYRYLRGMRIVSPLNFVSYTKVAATQLLGDRFGWQEYESKHYENRFTRFYEGWWLPGKFGYDKRRCYESSLVLTGQKTREEALAEMARSSYSEELVQEDKAYICEKLEIEQSDLDDWFRDENKTFRDYKNNYTILKSLIKAACVLGIEKRNFR